MESLDNMADAWLVFWLVWFRYPMMLGPVPARRTGHPTPRDAFALGI